MKKLYFLLPVFLLACSGGNEVPKDILPKKKMQAVLWDMMRAGEFLDAYVFPRDTTGMDKNAKALEWYENIYRLHQVSRAGFEKSYAWYRDHPAVMKEVLDSLSKQQANPPPQPLPAVADTTVRRDTQNKARKIPTAGARIMQLNDSIKRMRIQNAKPR